MSNLAEIHDGIQGEWSNLLDSWQEAQAVWKDEVAEKFSKRFLAQWEAEIPTFLSSLESLEEELQAAKRELN